MKAKKGKYDNVQSKLMQPSSKPSPPGRGAAARGPGPAAGPGMTAIVDGVRPGSVVPAWNSPAKEGPPSRFGIGAAHMGGGGSRFMEFLAPGVDAEGETSPELRKHRVETPPESRASRDAKRRLCAFANRQKALDERRERLIAAVNAEAALPIVSAPTKVLLQLAPANFGQIEREHTMGEVLSRRQVTNRSLVPSKFDVKEEDLIMVGEVSNRTKEKEFRHFFKAKAQRATPTDAQVAAYRHGEGVPHTIEEGAGFEMLNA